MTLSIRRALLYDYPASLGWTFVLGFWVIALLYPDARHLLVHYPPYLIVGAAWTLFWSTLVVLRVFRLSRLFRIGRVAKARVTTVWAPRWRRGTPFSYNFTFDHAGHPISALMHVPRWSWRPTLTHGQTVQAIYDPGAPKRAVIAQFFEAQP